MPDNPMTPEGLVDYILNDTSDYDHCIEAVTVRDESIRREAKREERNDICRWLLGDCT